MENNINSGWETTPIPENPSDSVDPEILFDSIINKLDKVKKDRVAEVVAASSDIWKLPKEMRTTILEKYIIDPDLLKAQKKWDEDFSRLWDELDNPGGRKDASEISEEVRRKIGDRP